MPYRDRHINRISHKSDIVMSGAALIDEYINWWYRGYNLRSVCKMNVDNISWNRAEFVSDMDAYKFDTVLPQIYLAAKVMAHNDINYLYDLIANHTKTILGYMSLWLQRQVTIFIVCHYGLDKLYSMVDRMSCTHLIYAFMFANKDDKSWPTFARRLTHSEHGNYLVADSYEIDEKSLFQTLCIDEFV